MNEYTKQKLKGLAAGVFFLICLALVFIGQRTVSYASLLLMMAGLGGLLLLLYLYNKRYAKKSRED